MNDIADLTRTLADDLVQHGARLTSDALVLSGGRAIGWRWPEGTQADHAEVGPAARAVRILAELDGKLAKIDGDVMASDVAKAMGRDKAIAAVALDLNIIANGADLDERSLVELERQHLAAERPRDPVEQLVDMEVRGWFRGLDPKERAEALRDAGPELLLPLVRSPIPMPAGIKETVAARWRQVRDEASPERAAAIEGRRERLAALRLVIDHARAALPPPSKPPAPTVRRVA